MSSLVFCLKFTPKIPIDVTSKIGRVYDLIMWFCKKSSWNVHSPTIALITINDQTINIMQWHEIKPKENTIVGQRKTFATVTLTVF